MKPQELWTQYPTQLYQMLRRRGDATMAPINTQAANQGSWLMGSLSESPLFKRAGSEMREIETPHPGRGADPAAVPVVAGHGRRIALPGAVAVGLKAAAPRKALAKRDLRTQ